MDDEEVEQLARAIATILRPIIEREAQRRPAIQDVPTPAPTKAKGALTREEAAKYLGTSVTTIWRLKSTGQIACTSYGTYPVVSLDAHLQREVEKSK